MRPELSKFQSTFDYLDGLGSNDSRFNQKARRVNEKFSSGKGRISKKGRVLTQNTKRYAENVRKWSSEYLEFVLYKIVYALVSPFPPTKENLAKELGITKRVLFELINTAQYLEIKKSLRKDMRDKWGADIDQVVIQTAIRRKDMTAAKLFYELQGELVRKLEVEKKNELPQTAEEKQKMINKLQEEINQVFSKSLMSGRKK